MKKAKMIKGAAISWLIFLFILCPLRFGFPNHFNLVNVSSESGEILLIEEDTIWRRNDNLFFDKDIYVEYGATLTIEPGAVIKFKRDSNWTAPTLNIMGGRIFASGTQKEPIIFTAESSEDTFFINFENTPDRLEQAVLPSFFRYVEISGGGEDIGGDPLQSFHKRKFIFSTVLASSDGRSAFYYQGGKMHIENSRFYDNKYADIEVMADNGGDNPDDYLEIVNSNFEGDDDQFALRSNAECWRYYSDSPCVSSIILKDNWYGEADGPTQENFSDKKGKKITGQYELLDWKSDDIIIDPVIIIPGIMGSAKIKNEWKIDPIAHTYDNLIESLVRNGYEKEKNIFEFAYDWKKKNLETAYFLGDKIEDIKATTKISRVDLVGHSMGGLVARAYIENINTNNVDQLITLGTPHRGAPKAYLQWEASEGFFGWKDAILRHHFTQEAKHNGYDNLYDYIRAKVPSIAELLPDYNYLMDASDGSMRNYPDNYPRNIFLEDLNKAKNKEKINGINFTNIVGDLENDKNTISGFRLKNSEIINRWEDGMPENFYKSNTDQGLNYSNGDRTVPLFSASDIMADRKITIKSSHNDLPTEAQCDVFRELTGEKDCNYTTVFNITNIFLINVFSPIDIQVVAPDGKRIGKNFSTGGVLNEIEGAFYTGSDVDSEFISIPNPQNGNYQILTQGTGSGEYRIEATRIIEGQNSSQDTTESSVVFNGTTSPGSNSNFVAAVDDDAVINPAFEVKSSNNGTSENGSSGHKKSKEKHGAVVIEKNNTFTNELMTYSALQTMPVPEFDKIQDQKIFGLSTRQYDTQPLENRAYSSQGISSVWSGIIFIFQKMQSFFSWFFSFF